MEETRMANIIPHLSPNQIAAIPSRAEQKVYTALQAQMPNDWLVVHSLEFIMATSKYNSHGDREADFVIFAPKYGVLVVEVKGGGIEYDKRIDQWYSIDKNQCKNEIKNPLRQAKDAKFEIRSHLKQKLRNKNLLIAHAALFPDLDNKNPLVSPDIPIDILGTYKNLTDLKQWAISIFEYFAGEQPIFDPLEAMGVKVAEQIYGKKISILPTLRIAIEEEVQKQIELTNQQKTILRQLKRRKEAIIEGGAGTGKTVLALDHAQTLAGQGLKTLLLCYNQKLGNTLKAKSEGINNLHSMDFHEFCSWRIRQVKNDTGRDLIEESKLCYPNEDKFDVLMPDALINSYDVSPIEYDVIIIDEGQDFRAEFWLAIEMLKERNDETKLYIFLDGNQAIYTANNELPIDCEPLHLFDNCRNTKPIHNLAYQYYQGTEVEAPDIEGEPIQFSANDSFENQAKEIDKIVSKLINNDGIDPKDIAVIVLGNFYDAESVLKNTKHNKLWAYKAFSPETKVLVETAKRFKGLEAKIILLWITSPEAMDKKLLYVSISRARFRLWIIGDDYINNITCTDPGSI
jgi:ATP:corrinoid adenosyltransferase